MQSTPPSKVNPSSLVTPPSSKPSGPRFQQLDDWQTTPTRKNVVHDSRTTYPSPTEKTDATLTKKIQFMRDKFAFRDPKKTVQTTAARFYETPSVSSDNVTARGVPTTPTAYDTPSASVDFDDNGECLDLDALEDIIVNLDSDDDVFDDARVLTENVVPPGSGVEERVQCTTPTSAPPETNERIECLKEYVQTHHTDALTKALEQSQFNKQKSGANINRFDVTLDINLDVLRLHNPILSSEIISPQQEKPDVSSLDDDFHSACLYHLQGLIGDTHVVLPEQLRVRLKIESVPPSSELRSDTISDALRLMRKSHTSNGSQLLSIKGIIGALWHPISMIYSQTYRCANLRCNDPSYLHYIPTAPAWRRVLRREAQEGDYLPATTSVYLHEVDVLCSCCGEEMQELVVDRVYVIRQQGRIESTLERGLLYSGLDHPGGVGSMSSSLLFVMEDDLANTVRPGDYVEIIGHLNRFTPFGSNNASHGAIPLFDPERGGVSGKHGVYVVVNNIRRIDASRDKIERRSQRGILPLIPSDPMELYRHLPAGIQRLRNEELSAWSFTQRLVDMFCDDHVPRQSYRRLRLLLLLSLVSIPTHPSPLTTEDSKIRQPRKSIHVHILSSTRTPILQSLMEYAAGMKSSASWTRGEGGKLPDLLCAWAPSETKGQVGPEKTETMSGKPRARGKTGGVALETVGVAGVADTVRGGILLIESDGLGTTAAERGGAAKQISAALDGHHPGTRPVDPGCVWMLSISQESSDKGKRRKTSSGNEADDVMRDCPGFIRPVIDQFDMCLRIKASVEAKNQHPIIDAVLLRAMGMDAESMERLGKINDCPWRLTSDEFAEFIFVASNLPVRLSTECKDLLRSYWYARRRMLCVTTPGISPVASMETLLRLAASHAKLCLRTVGSLDDALVSILLYEEHTTTRHQSSLLGFSALPDDGENLTKLYASPHLPPKPPRRRIEPDEDGTYGVGGPDESAEEEGDAERREREEEWMSRFYGHLMRVCKTCGQQGPVLVVRGE